MLLNTPLVQVLASVADESANPAAVDPAEHEFAFVVHIDRCIGCGKCVEACGIENHVPEGYTRTWVERYAITRDGVHVDAIDSSHGAGAGFPPLGEQLERDALRGFFVPKLCNHCEQAPCVQVCPVGATFTAPGGFVLVDPEHCIACGYCIQACPYGARFMNPESHVADKCSWCYHRVVAGRQPACVEVCPTGARLFGDLGKPGGEVAKIYTEGRWSQLKPEMHTESRCLYPGLPQEVM